MVKVGSSKIEIDILTILLAKKLLRAGEIAEKISEINMISAPAVYPYLKRLNENGYILRKKARI